MYVTDITDEWAWSSGEPRPYHLQRPPTNWVVRQTETRLNSHTSPYHSLTKILVVLQLLLKQTQESCGVVQFLIFTTQARGGKTIFALEIRDLGLRYSLLNPCRWCFEQSHLIEPFPVGCRGGFDRHGWTLRVAKRTKPPFPVEIERLSPRSRVLLGAREEAKLFAKMPLLTHSKHLSVLTGGSSQNGRESP